MLRVLRIHRTVLNFPRKVHLQQITAIRQTQTSKKAFLKEPSKEQALINKSIALGANSIVDAIAGSGKTTVILNQGVASSKAKILVLTYNSKLKEETRARATLAGLSKSVEVHSYHSFGCKYYTKNCKRDSGLLEVTGKTNGQDFSPSKPVPNYDIIVLDEAQDITKLLFTFFLKVTKDIINDPLCTKTPQIVMFGDRRQSIYKFRNSDERYLTFAEQLFKHTVINDSSWSRQPLNTSFRITRNMADFVNRVMVRVKPDLMNVVKEPGLPVIYLVGGPYNIVFWIVRHVQKLNKNGMKYEDMIILAPSVRKITVDKSPLAVLANALSEAGILVHITSGEESVNEEVTKGKLLFTTFHQSKGIERKAVFVFQFDESYLRFFGRKNGDLLNTFTCPNEMYVACTRATEQLILAGEALKGDHIPFLDKKELDVMIGDGRVEFVNTYSLNDKDKYYNQVKPAVKSFESAKQIAVTKLTKWLPDHITDSVISRLDITLERKPCHNISLPQVVSFGTHKESVADLNGLAIPALFESKFYGPHDSTMYRYLKEELINNKDVEKDKILLAFRDKFKKFNKRVPYPSSIAHMLELSCLYEGVRDDYVHRSNQIKSFDWLDGQDYDKCVQFLDSLLNSRDYSRRRLQFEYDLLHEDEGRFDGLTFFGAADIVTETAVYEIKCVEELSNAHFVQLAMYAWLYNRSSPCNGKKFQLVNLLSGEVWQINASHAALEQIVEEVISQYLNPPTLNQRDDEFVAQMGALVREYIPLNDRARAVLDSGGALESIEDDEPKMI